MKAEEKFQKNDISAADLLAIVMRRSLKKMTPSFSISEATFDDWVREARAIKGDPLELAGAIEWAITQNDYWTEWLNSMSRFMEKSETILGQYRGVCRKAKILEEREGKESPALIELRKNYQEGAARFQIETSEVQRRFEERFLPEVAKCTRPHLPPDKGLDKERWVAVNFVPWVHAKDNSRVPLALQSTPEALVPCDLCLKACNATYRAVVAEVKTEIYGNPNWQTTAV